MNLQEGNAINSISHLFDYNPPFPYRILNHLQNTLSYSLPQVKIGYAFFPSPPPLCSTPFRMDTTVVHFILLGRYSQLKEAVSLTRVKISTFVCILVLGWYILCLWIFFGITEISHGAFIIFLQTEGPKEAKDFASHHLSIFPVKTPAESSMRADTVS